MSSKPLSLHKPYFGVRHALRSLQKTDDADVAYLQELWLLDFGHSADVVDTNFVANSAAAVTRRLPQRLVPPPVGSVDVRRW